MTRFFVIVIAWLAAAAHIALCQSITGTIAGTVEDQTGAAVPQALVVALNTETGITHKTATGDAGVYVLPLLPLGEYQVTIEAAGFKKFGRGGLKLEAEQRLRVDARVELGSVSEEVTVSAAPPLVTTDQATLGRSFSPAQFDNVAISRS